MKSILANKLFLIILISVLAVSCVPHRRLLILRQTDAGNFDSSSFLSKALEYKIQPGDILNIEISSTSSNQLEIFNKEFDETARAQNNEASIFLNGYIVNKNGEIEMPLIGKTSVQNLTTNEINDTLKKKLTEYVNYVTVSAKLTNFRITLLGEVKTPGTQVIYNTNINILQAIGLAGDITDLGNKRKVKLIRKSATGAQVVILDVSRIDLIKAEHFYLQPNDVIYVEPLRAKVLKVNSSAVQISLSIATLLLLIYNLANRK